MTSVFCQNQALARSYSNLITGLDECDERFTWPPWGMALVAAVEELDGGEAELLEEALWESQDHSMVMAVSRGGGPDTDAGALTQSMVTPGHGGSDQGYRTWVSVHESDVKVLTEAVAAMAWNELSHHAGRHHAQAAKANRMRKEFIRERLLPAVDAALFDASGLHAALLECLSWVGQKDLSIGDDL